MIKTTIVGFGDSITLGYGVDINVSHIDRLERYMPQYYPSISWNIINSGINGDTTREAIGRITKDVLIHNPNIVLVLFGSNDSALYENQFRTQVEFEQNLTKIIQAIKGHNNRTGLNGCIPIPVLITPPPVCDDDPMPYNTNNRLKQYGYIVKSLATKFHCPLIDFFEYLLEEGGDQLCNYFQPDGVHLSNKGYDCLYDCVFSGISKLINYEGILKAYDHIEENDEIC